MIARITRTQGLRGAVRIRVEFDDMRLFAEGRDVVIAGADGRHETSIESLHFQHGRWVLKLKGIDSIEAAERWAGSELMIRTSELPEAEEGSYYDFDLKGCEVYEGDKCLGRVAEVVDYGATALLSVENEGGEVLIPFARRFMRNIDIARSRIDVELPEGLVDLGR